MPRFLASNTVDSSSLSTSVSLSIRLVLRNLPEIKFHFQYEKSVLPSDERIISLAVTELNLCDSKTLTASLRKLRNFSFLESSFP